MSKKIIVIPVPSYYYSQFSDFPFIVRYFKRFMDIDGYYIKKSDIPPLISEFDCILGCDDYDLGLYQVIHDFIRFIDSRLEEDACPVINRF